LQAADGEAGLIATREHRPDLILLDYNMPVLDGIGMLKLLREEPDIRRTPVIMLTANSAPTTIATVARLGVRDYVTKPFDGPLLLSKVARLITLSPRAVD
jgi:CheY-like chemotaxis protein